MMRSFRGRGGSIFGGGGESQTNTPDNLASKDTMEAIFGLCEGKIRGPINGLKSLYVGTTPFQNQDNSYNFDYFDVKFYPGDTSPTTPVKPRLGGLSNNSDVNVQLLEGVAVVRTTVDKNLDAIDVRLVIPQLYVSNSSGTSNNTLTFKIEWKQSSSTDWTNISGGTGNLTITGKTTVDYVKEYRIDVPNVDDTYDIRITKLTKENTTTSFATLLWESFQEITQSSATYPNTAILQIVGEATNQFTSIPQFWGEYEGFCELLIPSNYDPDARTYSGTWDGTFKIGYTNNPAWFLYNYVVNDQWGMSSIRTMSMDKYSVYDAAQWCDQMVPDGEGGSQPRYTFNALITEQQSGIDFARYVAGTFNAAAIDDNNGSIILLVDKDDAAIHLFSKENIIDGSLTYSENDVTQRYNDITVTFANSQLVQYAQDQRRVFSQPDIDKNGRIPLPFTAVGCTDEHEAIRRATYKLITATTEIWSVQFKTNRQGQYVQPFDVMLLSDPDMGWGVSGRIKQITGTRTFSLRDAFYSEGLSYVIQFKTPSGLFQANLVGLTLGYNSSLTVDADLPSDLPANANFEIEFATGNIGAAKPFRVISVDKVDGDTEQWQITGVEINRNKWDAADNATPVGTVPYSFEGNLSSCDPPSSVVVSQDFATSAGALLVDLTINWAASPDSFIKQYHVYDKVNDGAANEVAVTTELATTLYGVADGSHVIFVVAENLAGVQSTPAAASPSPIVVGGTTPVLTLASITGLELANQGPDTTFTGHDPAFDWRVNSTLYANYVDDPNVPASYGSVDPTFKSYIVRIYDTTTGDLIREDYPAVEAYTYTFEQNSLDAGGPRREFRIEVALEDIYGEISTFSKLVVQNPPPGVPVFTVTAGVGTVNINVTPPPDLDYVGVLVWLSETEGFTPDSSTLVYQGADSQVIIKGDPTTKYYGRVAAYDGFGTAGLNLSSEFNVQPLYVADNVPPAVPTGLALSTTSTIQADGTVLVTLNAAWTANDEADFVNYDIQIKQGSGNFVSFTTAQNSYQWPVPANQSFTVEVRARDTSGNLSAFSDPVTLTSAKDTTAPGAPTDLVATPAFKNIFLAWVLPGDSDIALTQVAENTVSNVDTATVIGSTSGSAFTRSGLSTGVTLYYWVRCIDTSGNIGAWSTIAYATTGSVGTTDIANAAITTAMIQDAAIDDAKIANVSASKLTAGSIMTAGVDISGAYADGTTPVSALADPIALANTKETKLEPGLVEISGSTTLASWQNGGDETKIDGGAIAANTIAANTVTIGLRGVVMEGLQFQANSPAANNIAWTAGTITYLDNTGTSQSQNIASGSAAWSTGTLYIYWTQGATTLSTTTDPAVAQGTNNIVLGTYRGGTDMIVTYGRTVIDGSTIVTGSITASQLNVSTLSAIAANIGTVTAGELNSSDGVNFIDLNATGSTPFMSLDSGTYVLNADGTGTLGTALLANGAFSSVVSVEADNVTGTVSSPGGVPNIVSASITTSGNPIGIWLALDSIQITSTKANSNSSLGLEIVTYVDGLAVRGSVFPIVKQAGDTNTYFANIGFPLSFTGTDAIEYTVADSVQYSDVLLVDVSAGSHTVTTALVVTSLGSGQTLTYTFPTATIMMQELKR